MATHVSKHQCIQSWPLPGKTKQVTPNLLTSKCTAFTPRSLSGLRIEDLWLLKVPFGRELFCALCSRPGLVGFVAFSGVSCVVIAWATMVCWPENLWGIISSISPFQKDDINKQHIWSSEKMSIQSSGTSKNHAGICFTLPLCSDKELATARPY